MIHLQDVTVAYDAGVALNQVTLQIEKGEFVYLVGMTGAGKTTLLKLLYCDERPVSGSVSVAGRRLTDLAARDIPALRRSMGIVPQDFGLLQDRTVYENVAFVLWVTGASYRHIRRRVPDVLELVGLRDRPNAFPAELSGGEKQRVAIARALANEPPLLIADEPTGNLDPETSLGIANLLEYINDTGTTVVVATHDKLMVDTFRKRVVQIEDGSIVRDENPGTYDGVSAGEA